MSRPAPIGACCDAIHLSTVDDIARLPGLVHSHFAGHINSNFNEKCISACPSFAPVAEMYCSQTPRRTHPYEPTSIMYKRRRRRAWGYR